MMEMMDYWHYKRCDNNPCYWCPVAGNKDKSNQALFTLELQR